MTTYPFYDHPTDRSWCQEHSYSNADQARCERGGAMLNDHGDFDEPLSEDTPECYKGRVTNENIPCCNGYELSISEEGNYSECVLASGHTDSGSDSGSKETTPESCTEGRTISFSEVESDFFGYPKCPQGYLPDIVQAPNPLLFQPAYGACICSDLPAEEKQKIKSDGRDQYQKQKEKETETGILGALGSLEKILPTIIILMIVSTVLGLFKR